jgi:hypothetical protein
MTTILLLIDEKAVIIMLNNLLYGNVIAYFYMACCDDKECKFIRREFSYAKFEQTLVLPDDVDKTHIKAKVKHGVLHIKLPRKATEEKPQTQQNIAIE